MLAYDYPLLGLFWTMLFWFMWIAWIVLVFHVIGDIFRNQDMGGFAKGLWTLLVIVLPWFGVLLYLIVNGSSMRQRDVDEAKAQEDAFAAYVRSVGTNGSTSSADELAKLADLRNQGVITDAEFDRKKAGLLA